MSLASGSRLDSDGKEFSRWEIRSPHLSLNRICGTFAEGRKYAATPLMLFQILSIALGSFLGTVTFDGPLAEELYNPSLKN
jgi:hypothetical protein